MIDVYADNGKKPYMIKSTLKSYDSNVIHITHFNKSVTDDNMINYWLNSYGLDSWVIVTDLNLQSLVDYLCNLGYTVKLY